MPREGIDSVSHRQVFREEIRNAIREAIFSGKLIPGDRIIETYWAKELGVSQGPVREAIRDLEAMGLFFCKNQTSKNGKQSGFSQTPG